jgi:hypothetical protein
MKAWMVRALTTTTVAVALCMTAPTSRAADLPAAPAGSSWAIEDTWAKVKPDDAGRWPEIKVADTSAYRDTTDDGTGMVAANCENFPNEGPGNVFDNSDAKLCAKQADIQVDYTYAAGRKEAIVAYALTSANDFPERDPRDWQVLGSDDGQTWTTVDERKDETFMDRHFKRVFEVQKPAAFATYRFKVLKNSGAVSSQIEEIELFVPKAPAKKLTDAEVDAFLNSAAAGEGFVPLFKADLADAVYPKGVWSVSDGVLTATEDQAIWSGKDHERCVIDLEFQTAPGTNSGVIVYCSNLDNWIPNSVEIQIADDFAKEWAEKPGTWQCAAIFGHLAAGKRMVKKPGEWNRFTILCYDQRLVVALNGEKVTDMDMSRWTSAKTNPDGSEIPPWLSRPFAGLQTRGRIGFQGKHAGAPIYFRNLRIRDLQ